MKRSNIAHQLITMTTGEIYRDDVRFQEWHAADWIIAFLVRKHCKQAEMTLPEIVKRHKEQARKSA